MFIPDVCCKFSKQILYAQNMFNVGQYLKRSSLSLISASEDAPAPSSFEAMDPERRLWLEHVIESMTVDVCKQLAECIKVQ